MSSNSGQVRGSPLNGNCNFFGQDPVIGRILLVVASFGSYIVDDSLGLKTEHPGVSNSSSFRCNSISKCSSVALVCFFM